MNNQIKLYEVKIYVPSWISKNVTELVRATSEEEAKEQIKNHSIYPLQGYKITSIIEMKEARSKYIVK